MPLTYDYVLFALDDNSKQGVCLDYVKNTLPEDASNRLRRWGYLSADLFEEGNLFDDNMGIEIMEDATQTGPGGPIKGRIPNKPEYGALRGKSHGRYLLLRIQTYSSELNENEDPQAGGAVPIHKYYLIAADVNYGWGYGGGENVCLDTFEGTHEDAKAHFEHTFGFFSESQKDIHGAAAIHGTPNAGEQTIPMEPRFEHLQGAPFRRFCLARILVPGRTVMSEQYETTDPTLPFLNPTEGNSDPMDGGKRTRKVSRKNRKASRKNSKSRKASRKSRNAKRKMRK